MKYKVEPWKHQRDAIERFKDYNHAALFMEMGTGKTAVAINLIRHKMNQHQRLLRTLVVCPPIVVSNWRREIEMHSDIPLEKVFLLTGPGAKREKIVRFRGFDDGLPAPAIFVTNYEALLMKGLFNVLCGWQPEIFIWDESHYLKSHTSQRSKRAFEIGNLYDPASRSARRPVLSCILSGTPVLNSPLDVFQQFKVLDGGETFGNNFFAFRARYCVDRNAGRVGRNYPDWQIKTAAKDGLDGTQSLSEKISEKGVRVTKKDCLDLPPLVETEVRVPLSKEQRGVYESLRSDLVAFINSGLSDGRPSAILGDMAIIKALRLMQIASGYVKTEDGREIYFRKNPKLEILEEQLEQLIPQHKVIVWAHFRKNYEMIRGVCEKLGLEEGKGYAEVYGGLTAKQRDDNVARFRGSDDCRVLIGNPGSGGIGINLVEADYAIYYSLGHSLGHYLQSRDRNHRGGSEQHSRITHIHLVAENTIEEKIREALRNKEEISFDVLHSAISAGKAFD